VTYFDTITHLHNKLAPAALLACVKLVLAKIDSVKTTVQILLHNS